MSGTTNKANLDSGEAQRRIYAVQDGSVWMIREIVTKQGYYIVWPGRFRSLESCQEEVKREMTFAAARR